MKKMDNAFYVRGKAFVMGNDHYDQMKPNLNNTINHAPAAEAKSESSRCQMVRCYS